MKIPPSQDYSLKKLQGTKAKYGSSPTERLNSGKHRAVQTHRDKVKTLSDEKNQFPHDRNLSPFGSNIHNQAKNILSIKSDPASLVGSPRVSQS